MHGYKSAARPLALLYGVLVAYATLYPFSGWRDVGVAPWAYLAAPLPRYWTRFDVAANFAGYVPLGLLATLALARGRAGPLAALGGALAAGSVSLVLEALQTYLPSRVASNLDLALNAAGGLLGAVAALLAERTGVLEGLRRARARWFVRNSRGALVLLALWPVGLLFPPAVAFGIGQVFERALAWFAEWAAGTPFAAWVPPGLELQPLRPELEAVCVALGVLAPCLLGFSVIRRRGRRAAFALSALVVAVAVAGLSASLTYGPVNAWSWVRPPVQLGLWIAVLGAAVMLMLPMRVCAAVLMAALAAQVVLVNTAPQTPYFTATLGEWEQGRFIHFHGLAQWIGWLWPFVAFGYLASRTAASDGGQPPLTRATRPAPLAGGSRAAPL